MSTGKVRRFALDGREAVASFPVVTLLAPEPLPVAGWREWVRFPDLHISPLKAKIDTGARTSALHASDILIRQDEVVEFLFHPFHRHPEITEQAFAPLVAMRTIRSSSGHVEQRPVIRTLLELGTWRWEIEVTLTTRTEMGFRLLLGREAVRGRFVIDPGASYLCSRRPTRRKARPHPAGEDAATP